MLPPCCSCSWALVYTGRSARLAPAAFGAAAPADSLKRGAQAALQAASDRAYQLFYTYFPLVAGSAVGRRAHGSSATNTQIIDLERGTVDNIARWAWVSARGGSTYVGWLSEVEPGFRMPWTCLRDGPTVTSGT